MITRCAQTAADSPTGLPSAVAFTDGDQLCIDGDPLVIEDASQDMRYQNASFRRLHDDFTRFVITQAADGGPSEITAYEKAGRVLTFTPVLLGTRTLVQVSPYAAGPQNIQATATNVKFGWGLQHVTDRNGNEMDVDWLQTSQTTNLHDLNAGADAVPSTIRYASNSGTGLTATKQITLNYETPLNYDWPRWISGVRFDSTAVLTSIQEFGTDPRNPASLMPVKTYNLSYESGGTLPSQYSRVQLSSLTECDGQTTGACKPPVTFYYGENDAISNGDDEWTLVDTGILDVRIADIASGTWPPHIYTNDLNSDGNSHLLFLNNNLQYMVALATGSLTSPSFATPVNTGLSTVASDYLFPFDPISTGSTTSLLITQELTTLDCSSTPFGQCVGIGSLPGSPPSFIGGTALPVPDISAAEVADVDGDGLPDLIETTTERTSPPQVNFDWNYHLNQGGNFATSSSVLINVARDDHRFVDIDGDGSAEVLTALPIGEVGTTSRFTALHAGGASTLTTLDTSNPDASPISYVFVDLNGDGLVDAVQLGASSGDSRAFVRFNSGNGFFAPLTFGISADGVNPLNVFDTAKRTIDFNHDGKQDILIRPYSNPGAAPTTVYVIWFDGFTLQTTALPSQVYSAINPGEVSSQQNQAEMMSVLDVNGDGLDDIVMLNHSSDSGGYYYLSLFVRGQAPTKNRLLVHIDRTGVRRGSATAPGEQFAIRYAPLSDPTVYPASTSGCSSRTYPQACVTSKLWVVAEIQRSPDQNPQTITNDTLYTYAGARADVRGRGFLGFTNTYESHLEELVEIERDYDLSSSSSLGQSTYPFIGMPTVMKNSAYFWRVDGTLGNRATTTTNTYAAVPTIGGAYFAYPTTTTQITQEDGLPGGLTVLTQDLVNTTEDCYGNLTSQSVSRIDGSSDSVTHSYTYANPPSGLALPCGVWPFPVQQDVVNETSQGTVGTVEVCGAVPGPLSRTKTLQFDANWQLQNAVTLASGNDRGEQPLTVSITRTGEGLVQSVKASESPARGGQSRQTTFAYDPLEHAFPAVEMDALGHYKQYAYHNAYGLLALSIDVDGQSTKSQYDGFGRLMSRSVTGGEQVSYSYCQSASIYPDADLRGDTVFRLLEKHDGDGNAGPRIVTEFNWVGKPTIQTKTRIDGQPTFETWGFREQDGLSVEHKSPNFGRGFASIQDQAAPNRRTTSTTTICSVSLKQI